MDHIFKVPSLLHMPPQCSKPLHVQKIENAVKLNCTKRVWDPNTNYDSSDDEEIIVDDDIDFDQEPSNAQNDTEFREMFNWDPERAWLINLLQETDNDDTDTSPVDYNFLLKMHSKQKELIHDTYKVNKNLYYGVGLLSSVDNYPEHKKMCGKFKKTVQKDVFVKPTAYSILPNLRNTLNKTRMNLNMGNAYQIKNVNPNTNTISTARNRLMRPPATAPRKRAKKFRNEEAKKKWEDVMTLKRKKVFSSIVKKEVGKQHRAKLNKHKEVLIQCKRAALQCQKVVRQKALQSARVVKEQQWRMKRLARENAAYWKRSKRVDREIRRKLEKEAEEQRKIDFEFIEAKRQQRKLNFLITQTELYAHFMSRKLGKGSAEEQLRILSQLDEEKNPRLASIDDYDCEVMKSKARKNAEDAFHSERARTRYFDMEAHSTKEINYLNCIEGEHPQPQMFQGNLKGYQLRGMNWLANLYDQGISGILADEMGLGKTVQSIAFLCHIAERYSVWGPFLIISPASTLHNWQQEIAKFVPQFKVVPYWGSPNERKILRQFWDQKNMHTKNASFHIVVTSYQIVITDIKYFNRVKWQYMILDEAQAIKSTSSMRWKTLLGFSCRNRLLLSGTPIQNSMAELWALLHFIMPTLFDSHEEFNEWFSKDIESHAENKTGIDEKHLSRLHMILKPFMLRRIKKDVENELSDKIEIMVCCPLTTRQKLLYMALKQKIRIEDLLHYTVGGGGDTHVDKNFTSNLMNLVMQFRKVCNHPELFERRNAKSPFYVIPLEYKVPYLIYDFNVRKKMFLIMLKYFVFTTCYITSTMNDQCNETIFNFARSLKLSPQDLYNIFYGNITHRWRNYFEMENDDYNVYHHLTFSRTKKLNLLRLRPILKLSSVLINTSAILKDLVFTCRNNGQFVIYTHTEHIYNSMPETLEHKKIRAKLLISEECESIIDVVNDDPRFHLLKELPYEERCPQIFTKQRTPFSGFLFASIPKINVTVPTLYCYSRKAMWDWEKFVDDYSWTALDYYWSKVTNNGLPQDINSIKYVTPGALDSIRPHHGWSNIAIPDKETLVTDSGKLSVLDGLLKRLKEGGHRVLIYSQMTRMIDLLEEYMVHRHHKFMRLDGSSKISDRRDMVADFQAKADIFVFLLSTRAGGLGINLTAADTVIFYDSDWNPTVDQQAMDRAHRLGQTKQVTVYRLICKGSIEERILQRAREKSEIQKLVISGGNFKPDSLKPKEVVSLLLDDEEIEQKYRQRTEERKQMEDLREMEKKRKHIPIYKTIPMPVSEVKKLKTESSESGIEDQSPSFDSGPSSPHSDSPVLMVNEDVSDVSVVETEVESPVSNKYAIYNLYGTTVKPRASSRGSSKRGRPRGSRRSSALGRFNTNIHIAPATAESPTELNANNFTAALAIYDFPGMSPTMPETSPTSSGYGGSPVIRRGPGRPRLKRGASTSNGPRGPYRPRKPAKPLPVPLPSDTGSNGSIPSISTNFSYLYDYLELQDP